MRSIGVDLEPWLAAGLLKFHADRPSRYGLETHLATMHQIVDPDDLTRVIRAAAEPS